MRNVFHETLLNHTLYNGWSGYNCLITHDNIVSHKSPSVKPRDSKCLGKVQAFNYISIVCVHVLKLTHS